MLIADGRSKTLRELVTLIDMTHYSKKARVTIKKLNSEKHTMTRVAVNPNQMANQLRETPQQRKGHKRRLKRKMDQAMTECDNEIDKFSLLELENALIFIKMGKA